MREKQCAVHTRVEHAILVQVSAIHFDTSQQLIPSLLAIFFDFIKTIISQLFHIEFSLLKADERRGYLCMNHLAFTGLKSDDGTGMISLLLQLAFGQSAIGYRSLIGKRLIELDNKIILKPFRYTTTIFRGITDDLVLFRNDLYIRTLIERVYGYIRMFVFRESKAEHSGTIRWCKFRHNVILSQIYLIIIWL